MLDSDVGSVEVYKISIKVFFRVGNLQDACRKWHANEIQRHPYESEMQYISPYQISSQM